MDNITPEGLSAELQPFIEMSREVGNRPDIIQSGGGNTSKKMGSIMAVKASGCKLKDMRPDHGYALLPHQAVCRVYRDSDRGPESEQETSKQVRALAIASPGLTPLRPSVEAGFHAMLGTCVIHSHSVYANLLTATKEGEGILRRLFGDCVLPFINPGAELCFAFSDLPLAAAPAGTVFLMNHGMVTWAPTEEECLRLHYKANERIAAELSLAPYPAATPLLKTASGYVSQNPFLAKALENGLTADALLATPLFPDQLVYLNNALTEQKIIFDGGDVRYLAPEAESEALEEVLLSMAYIFDNAREKSLTLQAMPISGIAFIQGWDAEKYRREASKTQA